MIRTGPLALALAVALASALVLGACGEGVISAEDDAADRTTTAASSYVRNCSYRPPGWSCKKVWLYNPLSQTSYQVEYTWNMTTSSSIRATAVWVSGGNGNWPLAVMSAGVPTWNKLASHKRIRTIVINFTDPRSAGNYSGGYWKKLVGYRVASKIYDLAVRRLISDGLTRGSYLTHVGGSNGSNMAAFALAYHGADSYLDQVVFNAGPASIDLADECGNPSSPANIDVGGRALGDSIAAAADQWMGWARSGNNYCRRRVSPPGDRISNLDPRARRSFPNLTVNTIIGMRDSYGLWILRSNRKWFDGVRARHMTLSCKANLGHEMDWNSTYDYVALGPRSSARRTVGANCTSFPLPTRSSGIRGVVDSVSRSGSSTYIRGWACFEGYYRSIPVHVYAGGPAGSGALVVGAAAAVLNESAVNVQCGTSGVAHRFVIPLSATKVAPHAGKRVYVHGISPSSNYPNATIFRSGWYRLPN